MIILKRNNTLSKQLEVVDIEIKKNEEILKGIYKRKEQLLKDLDKQGEEDRRYISQLKRELNNRLKEIDKKEQIELRPFQGERKKEEQERQKLSLLLGFGISTIGLIFLYISLSYFYIPLLLFLLTYLIVYNTYKTTVLSEVKNVKNKYKNLKDIKRKEIDSAIKDKEQEFRNRSSQKQMNIQREIVTVQGIINDQLDEYSKLNKGNKGENIVSEILFNHLSDEYFLLNDITIPTTNGRTTQIDHVLLTPYGIIALETKHIDGIFYPHSKTQWKWFPSDGTYTNKQVLTSNPQEQSIYHAQQLKRYLKGFSNITVQPLVVLTHRDTEYKGEWNEHCPVIPASRLEITVQSYKLGDPLSREQCLYIGEKLIEADKKYSHIHYSTNKN